MLSRHYLTFICQIPNELRSTRTYGPNFFWITLRANLKKKNSAQNIFFNVKILSCIVTVLKNLILSSKICYSPHLFFDVDKTFEFSEPPCCLRVRSQWAIAVAIFSLIFSIAWGDCDICLKGEKYHMKPCWEHNKELVHLAEDWINKSKSFFMEVFLILKLISINVENTKWFLNWVILKNESCPFRGNSVVSPFWWPCKLYYIDAAFFKKCGGMCNTAL